VPIDKSEAATCGEPAGEAQGKGLLTLFLLGFVGGLLALLTPCVFPMIPLTVSFFTKGSENRRKGMTNAFLYGFFIFTVYLILSLPFHLLDSVNPDILNDISTNVWLNIAFFLIFLVFAFSFFGYYELTLPSSWVNKASAAEGIGGVVGVFFMALTLALVSFSCTGPILGSLLAGALSSNGGATQLTVGMGGFGLALALPFGLFAAFPSWMSSLPKSGGWMTTVKVVLGFIELALALKFLSNADLVKHWGLLKIEPFLALWLLLALGLGLYLLGKIRFPHDSPLKKIAPARLALALASFAFAAYLATGFLYDEKAGSLKPLKLLSGLAPPACYSWFYPCDCPQNINCFKDFCEGLTYAKEVNKPILIDFTGHACVNCRKMEEHVWPEKEVYSFLKDDYVLISLYVDEKIELPAEEQKVVPMKSGGTRKLRTVGNKWAHFQTENFDNNSQPYYVLLSPDGKMLNQPVPYTPDARDYANFLQCGLDAFKTMQAGQSQLGAK
jgi:thiol:disulfide interchange protein DsbD